MLATVKMDVVYCTATTYNTFSHKPITERMNDKRYGWISGARSQIATCIKGRSATQSVDSIMPQCLIPASGCLLPS